MKNITLEEMLNVATQDILSNYAIGAPAYYYKDASGEYHAIVELDLFRRRFVTDNGDFSEFEWELRESHIYINESSEITPQNDEEDFMAVYNSRFDVLYLMFSDGSNSYGDDSLYGAVVYRDIDTEEITGYTFTHFFSMYWNDELPELPDNFNVTYEEIIIQLFEKRMISNREKDNNH